MKLKPMMPACCFLIISIAPGFAQKESVQNNEVASAWNLIAYEAANEHDQVFSLPRRTGHGLRNMQLRAERIGARLEVKMEGGMVMTLEAKAF